MEHFNVMFLTTVTFWAAAITADILVYYLTNTVSIDHGIGLFLCDTMLVV